MRGSINNLLKAWLLFAPNFITTVACYGSTTLPVDQATSHNEKILYYRNPMGLPDISSVPKKDTMGMDYIPVYEEESKGQGGTVKISPDKVQKLGVVVESAQLRFLSRDIQAFGRIHVDEGRIKAIAPKFEGWIEKLHIQAEGQEIRPGDPLIDVYSPNLIVAQRQYWAARDAENAMKGDSSVKELVAASLQRLLNLGLTAQQLKDLQQDRTISRTLTYYASFGGIVLEKPATLGMRFNAGDTLYKIADLSKVWILAEVFEQDIPLVQKGQEVKINVPAYPKIKFQGKIDLIYPQVNRETRTTKVRVTLDNPRGLLKSDMYITLILQAPLSSSKVLTVPSSAILDNGITKSLLIERGEGLFEPRIVEIGNQSDTYVEIIKGVKEGEKVVIKANFLIDAESNLKAALSAFKNEKNTAASKENQP